MRWVYENIGATILSTGGARVPIFVLAHDKREIMCHFVHRRSGEIACILPCIFRVGTAPTFLDTLCVLPGWTRA